MEPPGRPGRRIRLALAEDDEALREAVAELLRQRGLDVVQASDGCSRLGILRREEVALVITDLAMPALRGDEVLRLCRASGDQTPFVVITAEPAHAVNAVVTLEEVIVLKKPFTREALLSAIEEMLSAVEGAGAEGTSDQTAGVAAQAEPVRRG